MTAFNRFNQIDRRISNALEEIAVPQRPDYLDDVFQQTARMSQRPRWSFPERWLPMDTALPRPGFTRLPVRTFLVFGLMALLAAAALVIAGSRQRVPAPFGPAGNGAIAYSHAGDLYVRDSLTGQERLLFGGAGIEAFPSYSPDGRWLAYISTSDGVDHFSIARADGSSSRQVAVIPPGNAQAAWRPDSAAMALIYSIKDTPQLIIVSVDGSPDRRIDLPGLTPLDVSWEPPAGARMLVRAQGPGDDVGLYAIRADGSGLKDFDLPGISDFGSNYTLSGSTWSPDGRTIAYNSVERIGTTGVSHFRVRLIATDGTGGRAVAGPADPKIQEAWPAYSPDGKSILVHHWIFKSDSPTETYGWLAVMPADGSAPARDIGPMIPGGEDSGLIKIWSPDGTRVLMLASQMQQVFSIDPTTGAYERLPWTSELPDWQRVAP